MKHRKSKRMTQREQMPTVLKTVLKAAMATGKPVKMVSHAQSVTGNQSKTAGTSRNNYNPKIHAKIRRKKLIFFKFYMNGTCWYGEKRIICKVVCSKHPYFHKQDT